MSATTPDEAPTVVELGRLEATHFGEYVVVDRIATGGMGTIDLAVHAPPNGVERPVALKRLRAEYSSNDQFVQMFVDEVRIAARISHPNVVPLLNAGVVDGQWFYAMDLLLGVPLKQVMEHLKTLASERTRAQWPAVLTRLVCDACEGLHAAHELRDENGELLRVVHRDVSPDNLFVGFDGAVRVIDFGIASARDRLAQTREGNLRGKLAYVAPERISQDGPADRRVDVWGLGVVLWEGLTLRRLFRRNDVVATVEAIRQGLVPPIRDHRPDVPIEVEEVVTRALALDPERRYPTTRDLGRALAEAARGAGWHAGLADVADWINDLLPGAAQRQRRVAEILGKVRRGTDAMAMAGTTATTIPAIPLPDPTVKATAAIVGPERKLNPLLFVALVGAGCVVGGMCAVILYAILG